MAHANARLTVRGRVLLVQRVVVTYNIGVQDQDTYVIKRIDEDFFDDL